MFDLENKQHFSLRKLSVGLASVLIGISFFSISQTVKADTVADQQASTVTNNVRSSDTQENGNTVESSSSDGNQVNNAKNNVTQVQNRTETKPKQDQTENTQQDFVPQTQEVNDSKDLGAEKGIVKTNSLQELDDQSNQVAETSAQHNTLGSGQKTQSSQKFAKKVLATNLIETNSSPMTNGGFDEATWGKLDVTKWQGSVQDGVYELTNYIGDSNHIIVPNEADFEKAGQSTNGLQVGITRDTVQSLVSKNQEQMTIAFSKTNDQKVKAIGTDWSNAFSYNSTLSKFDGSNLDVSSITNMSGMFGNTQISDLTSLANWDVSNVTNMYGMFQGNSISNLAPLTNWNTGNVTDMSWMFGGNKISNLTPLTNWNTSKVTDMYYMFAANPNLIDLRPIANWNLSNVHDQKSDQERFACLFAEDTKLDLTNINDTSLMKAFLKDSDMLGNAIFITNNADLVKATINKDLPNLTNTAKRTITFNIPNATPKTIVQTINYKAVAPVQIDYYYDDNAKIVQTYPVKESDWQLDTSKQNDDVVIDGVIDFKPVEIIQVNGYKAHLIKDLVNPTVTTQDGTDVEILEETANPGDNIYHAVRYVAQDETQTVHYKGDDGQPAKEPDGKPVPDGTATGKTDQQATTPIPGGWKDKNPSETQNQTMPRPDDTGKVPPKDVTIEHDHTTVTPDKPATPGDKIAPGDNNKNTPNDHIYPNDTKAQKDNLNGIARRTITIETPDHTNQDSRTSTIVDQTIDYQRNADVDTVTGEVNSYGAWTPKDPAKTSFDSHKISAVNGYDIEVKGLDSTGYTKNDDGSITINAETPDPTKFANSTSDFDSAKVLLNQKITVEYNAKPQSVTIKYVDDDNGGKDASILDSTVQNQTIKGVTDQTVDITYPDLSSKWTVVSGEQPTYKLTADGNQEITVHLKHVTGVPLDPDHLSDGTKNPENDNKPVTSDDFKHTVTRTVTVDYPASYTGTKSDLNQTVTLTRSATYDKVTGIVTWGAWSTGKFDTETPVAISGYTPSVSSINEMPVTHDTADQAVHITYTAGQQSMTWTFVDDDESGKTVGSPITLTDDTDTSISTGDLAKKLAIPKNYDLDDKYTNTDATNVNQIPTSFTFHATNTPVTIHLKHHHQDIDASNLPTLPTVAKDKDDQHVITANDFSKTINRTIEFDTPTHESSTSFNTGAKAQHHDQQVTLQRQGDYDAVTGLVTWKPWSEANFDAVNVGKNGIPTFDGYDIDPDNSVGFDKDNNRIDAMHVTSDTKPNVVIIRYKAQDHKVTYHFVDENGKQQTEPNSTTPIADETVSGKTDDTVNTPKLPDGWVLDGDTLDPTVKIPTSDTTVNVKIKHSQITVTHDNPVKNGDNQGTTTDGNKGQGTTTADNKGQGTTTDGNKGQGTTTDGNKGQGTMPDDNKSQGTKTNGNKNDKKSAKNVVTKSGKGLDTKSSSKKITKNTLNSNGKGISNMVTTVSTIETANDNATSEGNIANTDNGAGAGVHIVQAATVNNGSKDLPQTGEKQGVMASIFGVLAAGLGILGLAGAKRKKKN